MRHFRFAPILKRTLLVPLFCASTVADGLDSLRCAIEADSLYQLAESSIESKESETAIRCARDASERYRRLSLRQEEARALLLLGQAQSADFPDSALRTLRQALDVSQSLADREGVAVTAHQLAKIHQDQANLAEALHYYQQSLAMRRELEDRRWEGITLINIGGVYSQQSEYEQALRYYFQGLAICRDLGMRLQEAHALGRIGIIHWERSSFDQALAYTNQKLAISKELADRRGEAYALSTLGTIYFGLSDYERAESHYTNSLAIVRELEDPRGECGLLINLGLVYYGLADYDLALQCLKQGLAKSRASANLHWEANALSNMEILLADLAEYDQALEQHQRSLAIFSSFGDRRNAAGTHLNIGSIYGKLGSHDLALNHFQLGLAICREIGVRLMESIALRSIGWVHIHLSDPDQAVLNLEQSLDISREIGDRSGVCSSLIALGKASNRLQDHDQAEVHSWRARRLADSLKVPELSAGVCAELGEHYFMCGRDSLARSCYAEAIRTFEAVRGDLAVEKHQSGYMTDKIDAYRRLAETQLRLGLKPEAFGTLENLRARSLLDILESGRADFTSMMSEEEGLREKVLIARLEEANSRIMETTGAENILLVRCWSSGTCGERSWKHSKRISTCDTRSYWNCGAAPNHWTCAAPSASSRGTRRPCTTCWWNTTFRRMLQTSSTHSL